MECLAGRELVAEGSGCKVERCACGTLHVTIGAVTLRMDVLLLESLAPVLAQAVHQLVARDAAVPFTPSRTLRS